LKHSWLGIVLLALSALAQAETRYVSDEFTVPLRRGPTTGHKIINAGLPTGTPLEVISEDKAAGFTEVRMQNGTEGWVPTQYLTNEPIARDRLVAATKKIETLTAELNNLRQGMKGEQAARNNAEGTSSDLNKQVKQLQAELAEIKRVSANAVATYEENKMLKGQTTELQQTVTDQGQQIKSLRSSEIEIWLLLGGGLVVVGLIGGVAIKSRPKRSGGW
jgi:SH3 domain protein